MSDQAKPEWRKELEAEQGDMTREEIEAQLMQQSEYQLDLDNIKPQKHHWVDRGLVVSCEGGDHPPHRSFKRR